jgi:CheY-like chemotaxis protein
MCAEPLTALRVLIVDDDKDNTDTLAVLLRLWGCEVCACYAGPDALESARTFHPHVAILDLLMPKMDGFDLARQLREQDGAGPIIVAVTGLMREADRAAQAGCDHYLLKPVDPDALLTVLRKQAAVAPTRLPVQPDGNG